MSLIELLNNRHFVSHRYHFCVHTNDLIIPRLISMFPNLSATVMLSKATDYHREFRLFIHRLISTATVFGSILRTPVHHTHFPHILLCKSDLTKMLGVRSGQSTKPDMNSLMNVTVNTCEANIRMRRRQRDNLAIYQNPTRGARLFWGNVQVGEDLSRPQIQPAKSIQFIHLADEAYLINTDNAPYSPPRWTTGTMLENMRFVRPFFIKFNDEKDIDTALELLKLADRCEDSKYRRERDYRLSMELLNPSTGSSCHATTRYSQWPLELHMQFGSCVELFRKVGCRTRSKGSMMTLIRNCVCVATACGCTPTVTSDAAISTEDRPPFSRRTARVRRRLRPIRSYTCCSGTLDSRLLPGIGPRHTYLAMASSWGNPDINDAEAGRSAKYFRFFREKKSGLFHFGAQRQVEGKHPGFEVKDDDFGLLSDLDESLVPSSAARMG